MPAAITTDRQRRQARRRLILWPFTTPLTDLGLYLLLLPLFWVMGFEQIVPVLWFGWAFAKLLLSRRTIRIPAPARLALLFAAWQWVSATSIDDNSNWVLFVKNFSSYLVGILACLIVVNAVKTRRDFDRVLSTTVFLTLCISLIGLGSSVGALPRSFRSLGSGLLPGSLRGSTFVQENVVWREVSRIPTPSGLFLDRFGRVSSVFIYPTGAARAYLLLLPLQAFLIVNSRGSRKLRLTVVLAISLVCFLLTLSRTAVVALVAAGVCLLAVRNLALRHPREGRVLFLSLVFSLAVISTLVTAFVSFRMGQIPAEEMFMAGRPDSYEVRLQVYQITLDSWLQHPLIGWGTQRKLPELPVGFPAGTHGEYLGFLYRYGLIGLLLHLSVYATIWPKILPHLFCRSGTKAKDSFLASFAAGLLAFNMSGVTYGLDWDATIPLLMWTVIGLSYFVLKTDGKAWEGTAHSEEAPQ